MGESFAVKMKLGLAGRQPHDFNILSLHPRSPSGAERFEGRFFRSKAYGIMDLGLCTFPAILDLSFCIYSIHEAVAETLKRIADPFILNDVDADTGDHQTI